MLGRDFARFVLEPPGRVRQDGLKSRARRGVEKVRGGLELLGPWLSRRYPG